MAIRVRSYSKINLGLAIGSVRADGFHELTTLYQTLEAHDLVTVSAERLGAAGRSRITLTCTDRRVPLDGRNTVWKMLERALALEPFRREAWAVHVAIDKRLPMQGGLGAGSANAAAALVGLEQETGLALAGAERLRIAAEVGSDVPLFLLGGAVLGLGRGEQVYPMPDLAPEGSPVEVVLALPGVGVSTPQAFRDWDALVAQTAVAAAGVPDREVRGDVGGGGPGLRDEPGRICLVDTSDILKTSTASGTVGTSETAERSETPGIPAIPGTARTAETSGAQPARFEGAGTGAVAGPSRTDEARTGAALTGASPSSNLMELSRALAAALCEPQTSSGVFPTHEREDLAGHTLPALVRTGIRNDFEAVVFRQHPLLGTIKRALLGLDGESVENPSTAPGALYAALSGSGSAMFGLYANSWAADAAEVRLQRIGVRRLRTRLLTRAAYRREMLIADLDAVAPGNPVGRSVK